MSNNAKASDAAALHAVLAEFARRSDVNDIATWYHDTVSMADEIVRLRAELAEAHERAVFLAQERDVAQQEVGELRAAIAQVRALHTPHDSEDGSPACDAECVACYEDYPCPTLRALDGEDV